MPVPTNISVDVCRTRGGGWRARAEAGGVTAQGRETQQADRAASDAIAELYVQLRRCDDTVPLPAVEGER